jgi:hypothetical protein
MGKIKVENLAIQSIILDLGIKIEKLENQIKQNKLQRIGSKEERITIGKMRFDQAKYLRQLKQQESTQKLSAKDKAHKIRQEAEALKAKELRLSREPFEPKPELTRKEREERDKKKVKQSHSTIDMWSRGTSKKYKALAKQNEASSLA